MTSRAEFVARFVREHCFEPRSIGPLTIGAEMELLALDATSRTVAPIFPTFDARCTLDVVREVGVELSWSESLSDKGVPKFADRRGGSLTFEPGGQLEYASSVHTSVDELLRELDHVEALLRDRATNAGIDLLSCGVDPCNGAEAAPLQLTADRYSRMAEYFASIGPDGARMMRQTASLQINVGGVSLLDRWTVANALAPVLVAMFANSARYARHDTGCASYRAETWRGVDPTRTGVFGDADAVAEYVQFALAAPAFLADRGARPFGELEESLVTESALATHLTTLFPEVRPRGYLEFRSIDAGDSARRAAAITLVAAVMSGNTPLPELLEVLPPPSAQSLVVAGRRGLGDASLQRAASDLRELMLQGVELS